MDSRGRPDQSTLNILTEFKKLAVEIANKQEKTLFLFSDFNQSGTLDLLSLNGYMECTEPSKLSLGFHLQAKKRTTNHMENEEIPSSAENLHPSSNFHKMISTIQGKINETQFNPINHDNSHSSILASNVETLNLEINTIESNIKCWIEVESNYFNFDIAPTSTECYLTNRQGLFSFSLKIESNQVDISTPRICTLFSNVPFQGDISKEFSPAKTIVNSIHHRMMKYKIDSDHALYLEGFQEWMIRGYKWRMTETSTFLQILPRDVNLLILSFALGLSVPETTEIVVNHNFFIFKSFILLKLNQEITSTEKIIKKGNENSNTANIDKTRHDKLVQYHSLFSDTGTPESLLKKLDEMQIKDKDLYEETAKKYYHRVKF